MLKIDGQGQAWWVPEYQTNPEYAKEYEAHVTALAETQRREELAKLRFGIPQPMRAFDPEKF